MTVNSRIIRTFLEWSPDAVDVPLLNGLRIQILPTIEDLPRARKHQYAAFVASEKLLVVWDDETMNVIARAKAIESELMELIWKAGLSTDEQEDQRKRSTAIAGKIDEETGEYTFGRSTNILNAILVSATLV